MVGLNGSMTVLGGTGGGEYFGGSAGDNRITAGTGPVTAFGGGAGATALVAGVGNDLLIGGSGVTLFLFVAGQTAGGSDTIPAGIRRMIS